MNVRFCGREYRWAQYVGVRFQYSRAIRPAHLTVYLQSTMLYGNFAALADLSGKRLTID